jgi:hypothetical protein
MAPTVVAQASSSGFFAAVGLAAGNAALLVLLIYSALRSRAALFKAHMGQPDVQLPLALETP